MTFASNSGLSVQPVLHFLGIDGKTSKPFFEPWAQEEVRQEASKTKFGERITRYSVNPEDPAQAGWGVIFGAGVEENARAELEPLLERRRQQAGVNFKSYEFQPGETLDLFRRRIQAGIGHVSPERLPYYLLLVGDPGQIPFDVQFDLDVQHAVGRLAFSEAKSYGIYAQSVLDHEDRAVATAAGLHLFSFDKQDDPPMEKALDFLVEPLASKFGGRSGFDFQLKTGSEATRDRLAESVLGGPAVVFTVGHSFLLEFDTEGQDEWQGSLITGSWRGGKIRPGDVYRAASVPPYADLAGRIFYLYGCHTAGTPEFSSFDWKGNTRRLARRPFVAPLAQRLLAPPEGKGALAVIGQVDWAVPDSSLAWAGVPQIDTFVDTLHAISDGLPVGLALETFGQRYASVAVETLRSQRRGAPSDPVATWTAYHDARAVVLLGDPLVASGPRNSAKS